MTDAQHYDVIVVGTGAGGGTIAHRLAPTGKRILLLERGDYLPRERDNWDSTAVFVKGKYRAPEFWFDKHGSRFPPEVNYYVGGNTKFYGAALFRMRPEDFGELREMVTHADVRRLQTDVTGHSVTSVVATVGDGGGEGSTVEFSADIVVVACGAVNSAVLLLRSTNDRHPQGLANSSDVVGRHYMRHNNLALMAVSKEPNDTRFQKTLALHDWYLGSDDWEYPLGGIQMLGKSDSEQIHGEAPRWAGAVSPDMPFEVLAHHAVDFWLCGEDLPTPDNRVTLDRDGGIHLALDEKNNIAGLNHLRHKLQGMLSHLGMHEHHLLSRSIYLHKGMPIGATAHQAGTVRFGRDPADSALDVDCKTHDLDNLYVVDTSFFPSIGAVNPSLTAIANALRVGDRIADRLR
ncbi:GMC oxidoreductase [Streptomyces mirabilis]|uniref:GMC oxidoreductase n=1 Tax=Streptomyces mirabilis TaxID=68239 RepID=A0A1I1ZU82_9ACTN|nr:GMC family oxidoreductase [Streptomyces mirabilis]SFE35219.1 GMC oxidoreductase [Streptomyces mirabilis]